MINKEIQSDSWEYDSIAKLFHWIIAILLVAMLVIGWYMMSIDKDPASGWYFKLHKSLGLVVGTLIIFRLMWRISHPPQYLPLTVPFWQIIASRIVHWSLYAFMVLMPLTGFLGTSFDNRLFFFGLTIPNWVNKNKSVASVFFNIHGVLAWILLSLIVIHILAAFKHLIFHRDNVFRRMWL